VAGVGLGLGLLAATGGSARAQSADEAGSCVAAGTCVEIVWLGNTNWCFKYRGGTVLMDTNLGPDGLRALDVVGCREADAIFIGHNHGDHNRGFRELAAELNAPVIATPLIATPGFEAETGRQLVLAQAGGLKATPLAVEHSGSAARLMGAAGSPDPYGYVLEFPVLDAQGRPIAFFWADTSTTVGLRDNPVDGLDYPALTRSVFDAIESPIALWFNFFGINRQIFQEFDAILDPRFFLVHHLGPLNPDLSVPFVNRFDPARAGLAGTAEEFGSELVALGDFFSTYEVRGDSVVKVERGFAQAFREP
jgi:hypothetical protein